MSEFIYAFSMAYPVTALAAFALGCITLISVVVIISMVVSDLCK